MPFLCQGGSAPAALTSACLCAQCYGEHLSSAMLHFHPGLRVTLLLLNVTQLLLTTASSFLLEAPTPFPCLEFRSPVGNVSHRTAFPLLASFYYPRSWQQSPSPQPQMGIATHSASPGCPASPCLQGQTKPGIPKSDHGEHPASISVRDSLNVERFLS